MWLALFVNAGDDLVGHLVHTLGPTELARRWMAGQPFTTGPGAGRIQHTLHRRYPTLPPRTRVALIEKVLRARGLEVVTPGEELWPRQLDDLGHTAPLLLCVRGNLRVVRPVSPSVAIVGTRRPSPIGVQAARTIARRQIDSGRTIVSGGARGIDATAHAVALDAGVPTVAVVAQSPDRPYPPEHRGLFDDIAHSGLLVGEVLPGVKLGPKAFLARNRLIAALAQVTIVVEAPWRSGAVNTAGHAATLERELIAVTYPTARPQNSGAERITEALAGVALTWPE